MKSTLKFLNLGSNIKDNMLCELFHGWKQMEVTSQHDGQLGLAHALMGVDIWIDTLVPWSIWR